MTHSALAVFSGKSVRQIIELGGSRSWLLSPRNARKQRYLVCVRNAQSNAPDATEQHGSAFLIGQISGLIELPAENGVPRWHVAIAAYAIIDQPHVWKGWRNPVRYTSLEDLGISVDGLTFTPLTPSETELPVDKPIIAAREPPKLTIAQAKAGLAAMFGVSPESIDITIHG